MVKIHKTKLTDALLHPSMPSSPFIPLLLLPQQNIFSFLFEGAIGFYGMAEA